MVRAPQPLAKSRPRGDYPGLGSPGHCLTGLEKGVTIPAIASSILFGTPAS